MGVTVGGASCRSSVVVFRVAHDPCPRPTPHITTTAPSRPEVTTTNRIVRQHPLLHARDHFWENQSRETYMARLKDTSFSIQAHLDAAEAMKKNPNQVKKKIGKALHPVSLDEIAEAGDML